MSTGSAKETRVLIVEDNFVVADALRFLVESYGGFVSTIVPTLERAFAAFAADPIDVAVLDVNLNGTSVVPFAERLHAEGVPFVFLTGYGDEELLPEHLRDYPRLGKPAESERLILTLQELALRRGSDPGCS